MQIILVAAFGLAGVMSRFAVDKLAAGQGLAAPYGTITINIVGSALAGVFYVLGTERGLLSPRLSVGLMVGFCGGFTTFSAYTLQAVTLAEKGALPGVVYLFVSPLLGFAAAYLGVLAARSFSGV